MLKPKSFSKSKGQSAVEMALILPIVILILTGIIDFGLVFNNFLVISNASREGARSAAVGATDGEIDLMVRSLTTTLDQTKIKITIYPTELLRKDGQEAAVTVEYDNNLITPIIGSIVPNPLHLIGKTVMRVE